MKINLLFLLLLLSNSCASLIQQKQKDIALSEIELLHIGQTNKNEIEKVFGKASQIIAKSNLNEVWIYRNDQGFQNASLTFNQIGNLVGAAWLPVDTKNIYSLQQILDHFKNVKFEIKKEGWDKQGHYYSEDTRYTDEKNGISFVVNASDQSVLMIGFGISASRIPAKL